MALISHTWELLTFGVAFWLVTPWLWLRIKLPFVREIESADNVQNYEAAYRQALPKLRFLWRYGGLIAFADYGLDALERTQNNWLSGTAVPCLRVVAVGLIAYSITLGIDLIFRGAKIAGCEIRSTGISRSPRWLSSFALAVLCHVTEVAGLFLIGAIAISRFNGIGSETILAVAIALIIGPYLGPVTQLLDSVGREVRED